MHRDVANGRAYTIDGAEQFMFTNCFCWGYLVGCTFEDLDADGKFSAGSWIGGGFDTVAVGILVKSGISMTGCKFQGIDIIPSDCALKCDDSPTYDPPSPVELLKPRIIIHGMTVHAAPPVGPYGRAVWMTPSSWCKVIWSGGFAIDYSLELIKVESPNAVLRLYAVDGAGPAATRLDLVAGADCRDTDPMP